MIRDENPYGWGVDNIPMFRQLPASGTSPLAVANPFRGVAGNLSEDVHWPQTIFCVVLTCLIMAGLYFFGHHPSPPPVKPAPPVEVAFQLPEEVPVVPPPVVAAPPPLVVRQVPPPPAPKILKKPPPPPPPKKVAVRPPPPEPTPLVAPAPVETPLPLPSRMLSPAPKRRVVEQQVPLPQKQALVAKAEPDLLPAPSRATYKETPAPAAVALPERNSAFTARSPGVEPGAPSTRPRLAERAPARQALPRETVAVPGSTAAPDLSNVAPGVSSRHYAAPRPGPALPAESRRGATVSAAGEVQNLGAPSAPARAAGSRERETATQLPTGPRNVTGFAAGGTEVAVNMPTATGQPVAAPRAAATAGPTSDSGGNYDFLDRATALDSSKLVNFNRLRTCLDPTAETTLKSRLAAMLTQRSRCRSGGVVFDIRNPESAYSIHLDIYTYEQRQFKDRCDALSLAVQACEARR